MQETVPASQSLVPDAQNYTITRGASTLMAYGETSQDAIHLASLSSVSTYAVDNGQLQHMFPDDGSNTS